MQSDRSSIQESSKNRMGRLLLLAAAMTGTMATWFAMTAVLPEVTKIWELSGLQNSLVTMMVQAGFVTGALVSAFFNLPDRLLPHQLFCWSAAATGLTTIATVFIPSSLYLVLLFRAMTGIALAGVYGPGLKLASSWFQKGRGMALGCVVGALTLGSAAPHLFRVAGSSNWETVLLLAGAAAILSGLLVRRAVPPGPYLNKAGPFHPSALPFVLRNKSVRLANYGYFGHSWELYAMWTWLALYLTDSFRKSGTAFPSVSASAWTFIIIGSGFSGAWAGGMLADRIGREKLAMWSLSISGTMALLMGVFYGAPPWITALFGMIWGISIIADSAQFSALVTEHADTRYVGSALTFQLAAGYALTILVIWLTAWFESIVGWRFAFFILLPGPFIGFLAMRTLKKGTLVRIHIQYPEFLLVRLSKKLWLCCCSGFSAGPSITSPV